MLTIVSAAAALQTFTPFAFYSTLYAEMAMNYHIDNILIWDNFREKGECPLCGIYLTIEGKFVSSYLNEAVMEDSCRGEVNRYGFCPRHFEQLYMGDNKLGLALQAHTRLGYLMKEIEVAESRRAAQKMADKLMGHLKSCVICSLIGPHMERYAGAVAQMYGKDGEFKKLFWEGKGFCMGHFCLLLNASRNAGSCEKEYLRALSQVQAKNLERLHAELGHFADMFDYKSNGKPWGTVKDALERCINKICGRIIEKP
jgi:hypothetical protein